MVLIHRHDVKKRCQCMGNYGAGIGKVYTRGGKRMRKKNKLLESFGSKLLNGLMDAGKNLYENNKDTINKAIKDKAGNIVNSIIEKTKESDMVPDIVKKKLVDNSDLISSVSKKYIDQMVNKGSKMADTVVDIGINKMKSYDPALQRKGQITETTYVNREPSTFVAPTSTNLVTGTSSTERPTTNNFYGYGYRKTKRGRGLNIL